jgi:guanine nucleotide-binding protein G(i) subunit alpha
MGLCASKANLTPEEKDEMKRNEAIDRQNEKEYIADSQIRKLLLLGAGESGKSTLFKQLTTLYGEGIPRAQMNQYTNAIHLLIIDSLRILCIQSDALNPDYGTGVKSPEARASVDYVVKNVSQDMEEVSADLAEHIKVIWKDPGIQKTYELRNKFQLLDSCGYFFENVDRVITSGYEPSYEDVIRCRVRSTGIVETRFDISGMKFLLVDVGGQRNERKKWIHSFEGVTAVIFVAALSEFDQVLFEDGSTNRLSESLQLFNWVCTNQFFLNTPVLLFLNKRDLFEAKVRRPGYMAKFCDDYKGDTNVDLATEYMMNKFLGVLTDEKRKQVNVHVTCATDKDNVFKVFNDVKEILIRQAMTRSGIM